MNQKQPNDTLFQAADKGDLCAAIAALELGADLNAVHPEFHDWPLQHAVENGHFLVAKELLERGALVDRAEEPFLESSKNRAYVSFLEGGESGASVCPPLLLAARFGRVDLVCLLLEYKAQVECKDAEGTTPLMWAAENGNVGIVSALLDHNAKVDAKNNEGVSALMFAAEKGHAEVASFLLEHNAKVEDMAKDGMTALILAAREGHSNVVSILLERMAQDIDSSLSGNVLLGNNAQGSAALTHAAGRGNHVCIELLLSDKFYEPLLEAAKNGHLETVKILLDNGACVNPRNEQATTALMLAAKNGHAEIVSFLLSSPHGENISIDRKNDYSWTALYFAVTSGHEECVTLLAGHGADLNIPHDDGWTALMLAAYNGHAAIASTLLEHGAKADVKDRKNRTALMIAAQNGRSNVIKSLLASANGSAGEEDRDADTLTVLMHAAIVGTVDCIDLLLEHGADLEATEEDGGRTALMIAICYGRLDAFEFLLDKGAYIEHRDKQGKTALMLAAENRNNGLSSGFVALLLERGADWRAVDDEGRTSLFYAASSGVVKTFLNLGLDINQQDRNTRTALMHAVCKEKVKGVTALCKNGADFSLRDKDGFSAVLFAAYSGDQNNCLQILLDSGANITDTSSDQENVLHIAAQNSNSEFIKRFISHHPDHIRHMANSRNAYGDTPLMVARRHKCVNAVQLLSEWTDSEDDDYLIMGAVARAC